MYVCYVDLSVGTTPGGKRTFYPRFSVGGAISLSFDYF